MNKKQKAVSGIMLGALVFGLLCLTTYGIYALLVRFYGHTFIAVPIVGTCSYLYVLYMQYRIFKG